MGFIQLLVSLWPFLKEMFVGERIKKTSVPGTEGDVDQAKQSQIKDSQTRNRNVFIWCMDKMQASKRFLAIVLVFLSLSLFVNYKVISKLSTMVLPPRSEEKDKSKNEPHNSREPKETPNIPRNDTSDRDVLFDQTVRELKNLYGGTT
jgi:hypothetical protein